MIRETPVRDNSSKAIPGPTKGRERLELPLRLRETDMIAGIKQFFDQFIAPGTQTAGATKEHALQVATAALLLELVRADGEIAPTERAAVAAALRGHFGLEAAEYETLLALAEAEAREANDYFQFTSLINRHCGREEKLRMVENLWRVAMADAHLDAHELHLMRKLADLLHIGHADYVAAKQRAREAANFPAPPPSMK